MSSDFPRRSMTLTCGKHKETNMQNDIDTRKRKRMDGDVAESSGTKIHCGGNITHSSGHSNNVQDVSVDKRWAGDDGNMPEKRMRWSHLTNRTEPSKVSVEDKGIQRKGKRKASVDARPPEKKTRCSINNTNATDPGERSVTDPKVEIKKRKASDDGEAPEKKRRCSSSSSSSVVSFITVSSGPKSCNTPEEYPDDDDGAHISHSFTNASAEEERIFEMSSTANTSRADFEDKYCQLSTIGKGGFGTVFNGFRKSDNLPVAIKHIPSRGVRWEKVMCNGKVFKIIREVTFMLKTAGLPGSVGQSTVVSLLDWYILEQELVLVMEKPANSMDLHSYLLSRGGSLDEHEAKMILRQLVDAAVDMHSKGVFHRDIKLQNVLVQVDSGVPTVRIIDFGCGSFSTETSYHSFCGTRAFFPPEWLDHQAYWARPTTVWQLGALFYSLLGRHEPFTTKSFIRNHIQINRALSTEVKILLHTCLARDPMWRISLEKLQLHPALRQRSPPPT